MLAAGGGGLMAACAPDSAAVAVALLVLAATAAAQDYPNRPVRLVVPFPPGGINDIVARVIAQHLGERLGKQVIVDNRGGAGGVVGSEIVANAPKDGHTLLDRVAGERGQSLALHAALRSAEILRAGRHAGRRAERRHGQSRPAGEQHQGVGRARQGKSPANCNMPRPASARSCIWPASCSRSPPASTSCTSRSAARARR